ncbi:unnamed protein product [Hermetia illucens]|uniref:Uncharacterized protein n=1 Tax=Hermetia illucens TaxID=343691 RepID=A0A7R8V0L8_HERIL|nr:unnamed protein product [Hermetia illucens]
MRSKKGPNLKQLLKEYAEIKKSVELVESSVNNSMREIRLKNLSKTVGKIFANIKKSQAKRNSAKTPEELRNERWRYARKRGNEFSDYAKKQLSFEAFERRLHMTLSSSEKSSIMSRRKSDEEKRCERIRLARIRGNEFSKEVLSQASKKSIKTKTNHWEALVKNYFRSIPYGNYYSSRNRLLYKDSIQEYDKEFHLLLLKCAIFEKEHEEVSGFLEHRIFRGLASSPTIHTLTPASEGSKQDSSESELSETTSMESVKPKASTSTPKSKDMGVQVSVGNISSASTLRWGETNSLTSEEAFTLLHASDSEFKEIVEKIGDH